MIISNIKTNNYRSLIDFTLDLNPNLNILVGANNVGKSNIVKLLDVFFNSKKMSEQDFPKNLNYRLNYNNKNSDVEPYIEVTFTEINLELREKLSNYLINNNYLVIRARFQKNGQFNMYSILDRNGSHAKLESEILPYFIYLGDVNQREISKDFIQKFIPNDIESRRNLVTYANQMLREILDSGFMVSIEKNDELYEITVIDEYGTLNDLSNKSSGVQQMVFMALILASNLDGDQNRRIFAMEEPEMNLHAGVQKKLFNLIKSISETVQTVVTTHSPIFIDKTDLEKVIQIGRNVSNSTIHVKNIIGENWYSIKKDLGISINDNLFLGDINMIVEGATEKILLPHFVNILRNEGVINFSNDMLNVISAESASNVKYFVDIVTQQSNLNSIAILDNDREGNNALKKIEEDSNLKQRVSIYQFNREGFDETEVEDIVNDSILTSAISNAINETVSIEEWETLSINEHTGKRMKFNKAIKKLEERTNKSISKINLAMEIKKLVTTRMDIEYFVETFQLIDKHIKSQPLR